MIKTRYMLVNALVMAGVDDHWVYSDDVAVILNGVKDNLTVVGNRVHIKDLVSGEVREYNEI